MRKVVMRIGIVRVVLDRKSVACFRFVQFALETLDVSQVGPRFGIGWLDLQRVLIAVNGLVQPSPARQRITHVVIGCNQVGLPDQRLPVGLQRFVNPVLMRQGIAEIVVEIGVIEPQCQRLLVRLHGRRIFFLGLQYVAKAEVQLGTVRIKSQRLPEIFLGAGKILSQLSQRSEVYMGLQVIGTQRNRLLEGGDGALAVAERHASVTEVVVRLGMPRLECNHLTVGIRRLFENPEFLIHGSEQVPGLGIAAVRAADLLQQRFGLCQLAVL